jgi:hypothetical protein
MRPARDSSATLVVVLDDGTQHLLGRVDAARPDLALVDLLARLHLAARRRGGTLRVDDAPPQLCALLGLAGLAGVLAVQPRGQPELLEQVRVDEVVEPGDPAV